MIMEHSKHELKAEKNILCSLKKLSYNAPISP